MKENKLFRLQEAAIILFTIIVSGVASWLYGKNVYEIVKMIILIMIACGCMFFVIEVSRQKQLFLYDNAENFHRFTFLYLFFLAAVAVLPLLPEGGWPYLVIFVSLMLFSDQLIGMCAGSTLLLLTVLLSKSDSADIFIIYFLCGVTGGIMFSYLTESFKVGLPLLISLLMQFLGLCIHEVLMVNESLHIQMFMIPLGNIMICLILLMIVLRYFSFTVINKTRDIYMDINDPECPLLVKLKEHSKDEYYHAIHTAYLCDRIAKKLGLNDAVAKAGGYYHKIGILKGESSWENAKEILEENQYPEMVLNILKEFLDKQEKIIMKETVVLLMADTVISSISYLFSKDSSAKIDYEKLVQAVFKKKTEGGLLNSSSISIGELEEMKKILTEEKLYYDFLR